MERINFVPVNLISFINIIILRSFGTTHYYWIRTKEQKYNLFISLFFFFPLSVLFFPFQFYLFIFRFVLKLTLETPLINVKENETIIQIFLSWYIL